MRILARLILFLVVLAFALLPVGVSRSRTLSSFSAAISAASIQSAFEVREQDVAPHFPETADFSLKTSGFLAERAEMNYSLVGESVTVGVLADLKAPTDTVDTLVSLNLRTDYIPPGAEVNYYWQLTSPTGETVDTPTRTFQMEDDGFSWHNLTDAGNRVRAHWYEGDSAFGQDLVKTASDALDKLQVQTGAKLDRRAEIWVYATSDALFEALPLHQPEWVGGQAYPDLAVVMAYIENDDTAHSEIKRIIPHEMSHLLLYQASKNPYNTPPTWLDEGLAVHNQQVNDPSEDAALQGALEGGTLIPLKSLSGSFGADENEALLAYAESGSVVDFILSDPRYGADKLAKTVAAFKDGVTYDDALKAGLGVTTDDLDTQWRAWLPTQQFASSSGALPAWAATLVYVVLGILVALFIVGGLVTVFAVARRRR